MWLWLVIGCDVSVGGADRWRSFDIDGDGYSPDQGDCDDTSREVHPGADEACDGVDTDCDGELDNGYATTAWGPDADADGFGDATQAVAACGTLDHHVDNVLDCDDGDGTVHPGALDTAGDTIDADCNGREPGTGPIYAGSVVLDDDASAIAFCLAYDGVSGSLTLGPNLSTTHWASCLTEVGDQLVIETPVTQPERLGNLRHVGGALVILSDAMESLEGLDGLWELGSVNIASAPRLVSLAGIEHVDELTGNLVLERAPALRSLDGLQNVWRIGGSIDISGTGLPDLTGLDGLEELGGGIYLTEQQLDDFEGLTSLRGPIDFITLEDAEVGSFHGLESVSELRLELSLVDASVGSWDGLDGVTQAAAVHILAAEVPTNFGGFNPVIGALTLRGTPVRSLAGLTVTEASAGDFSFEESDGLSDLAVLRGVQELPGNLTIRALPALGDVDDLASLTYIRGDLNLSNLASLDNIDGLAALQTVDGDVNVMSNPLLDTELIRTWVSGIDVGGHVSIVSNGE